MRLLRPLLVLGLLLSTSGCMGYRLIRPGEVELPNYEPRDVPMPADCEALVQRAARDGVEGLSEPLARRVSFCQHQQLIRAQEEEAAARRLDAHASAASLALQVATVAIGALIAVLAWVF